MRAVITNGLTILILATYGYALKWSTETDNWWWVFPLGIAATVVGYFAVTDRAERMRGNREVAADFRRLISFVTRRQ